MIACWRGGLHLLARGKLRAPASAILRRWCPSESWRSLASAAAEPSATRGSRFDRILEVHKVDGNGEVTRTSTSIKELLLHTEMHVRDLIALSPDTVSTFTRHTPCILPRGDVMVMVMHPLRMVIFREHCLAFEPDDPAVKNVVKDVAMAVMMNREQRVPGGPESHMPFELVVVEQVLRSVCAAFTRIAELLALIVDTSLRSLADSASHDDELHRFVPLKDGLAVTQQNMQEIVDVLEQLLANDEDMLGMMLTEKSRLQRESDQLDYALHSEVELLLENYHRTLVLTCQRIALLKAKVQSAQEVFAINVDLYRNRVLRIEVLLTMVSASFASCTAVAGFYGMNLVNGLEQHPTAFNYVTLASLGVGSLIFTWALLLMRGQGRRTMQHDLESLQAYHDIFKHIRSISDALSNTSLDPNDPEIGSGSGFRKHFKQLLSEYRQQDVSFKEVDLLMDLMSKSAHTLRQRLGQLDATEEMVYRQLFASVMGQKGSHGNPSGVQTDLAGLIREVKEDIVAIATASSKKINNNNHQNGDSSNSNTSSNNDHNAGGQGDRSKGS